MAGGYLAIGSCISAITSNQVIAFVVSATISFLFTVSGLPIVLDFFSSWSGQTITDVVASLSFLTNYYDITRGLIDLRCLLYFFTLIFFFLYINVLIVNNMRDL
jgi:ABC-2 type transport system permease protein